MVTASEQAARQGDRLSYSIGTLVTNSDMYGAMKRSFEGNGFNAHNSEFLTIDNSNGNTADAFTGLNRLLNEAVGTYVILCHEDVLLLDDGLEALSERLSELTEIDPHWAVAGNAGGVSVGELAIRISDKFGVSQNLGGPFPRRVVSLDENFLVLKREARVGFSRDLSGFHMYGADVCLIADILGYTSYVIDFHVKHLGDGKTGESFDRSVSAFQAKWRRATRNRVIQTTCTCVELQPNVLSGRFFRKISRKLSKRVGASR